MMLYVLMSFCLMLKGTMQDALEEETFKYTSLGDTVMLTCKDTRVSTLIWRRKEHLVSDGKDINPSITGRWRYRITGDQTVGEFNLEISNITTEDLGDYYCEVQINKKAKQKKVVLKLANVSMAEVTESSDIGWTLQTGEENDTLYSSTDDVLKTSTENGITHVGILTDQSTVYTNGGKSTEDRGKQMVTTTISKEEEQGPVTGFTFSERFLYYGLLATGLVLVLILSVAINLCISRKCKTESFKPPEGICTIENAAGTSQVIEDISSNYESICESEMVRSSISNENKQVNIVVDLSPDLPVISRSPKSSTSSDKSYLEVIDDGFHPNPYEPMPTTDESEKLNKYCDSLDLIESKTISSPEYEVAIDEKETQLNGNEAVNIAKNETFPTGKENEIILITCASNDPISDVFNKHATSKEFENAPLSEHKETRGGFEIACGNKEEEIPGLYESLSSAREDNDRDYEKPRSSDTVYAHLSDQGMSLNDNQPNDVNEEEYLNPYHTLSRHDTDDSHDYSRIESNEKKEYVDEKS